ncbi:MAG: hypothetical protein V3571_06645 [Pseudodesulfovibrio sp.]
MIVKTLVSPCWLAPQAQLAASAERAAGLLASAAPGIDFPAMGRLGDIHGVPP